MRLDVSEAPVRHQRPRRLLERNYEEAVSNHQQKSVATVEASEAKAGWMNLSARCKGGEQKKNFFLGMTSFYPACHQKELPTFKVSLPTSNNLINPLQMCSAAYLLVAPDPVKLKFKINHHNYSILNHTIIRMQHIH